MSDDQRGEATDEDPDLPRVHGPGMLKTHPEMDKETFNGGQVRHQACPGQKLFFFFATLLFFLLVSVVF